MTETREEHAGPRSLRTRTDLSLPCLSADGAIGLVGSDRLNDGLVSFMPGLEMSTYLLEVEDHQHCLGNLSLPALSIWVQSFLISCAEIHSLWALLTTEED